MLKQQFGLFYEVDNINLTCIRIVTEYLRMINHDIGIGLGYFHSRYIGYQKSVYLLISAPLVKRIK